MPGNEWRVRAYKLVEHTICQLFGHRDTKYRSGYTICRRCGRPGRY